MKKRNMVRENPLVYHKRVIKSDGTIGWQGCKALPQSAAYTPYFCHAVFAIWEAEFPDAQLLD